MSRWSRDRWNFTTENDVHILPQNMRILAQTTGSIYCSEKLAAKNDASLCNVIFRETVDIVNDFFKNCDVLQAVDVV